MKRVAAVLAFLVAAVLPANAIDDALSLEANQAYLLANAKKKGVIIWPSGCSPVTTCLQFKILQNGFGKHPGLTDTVSVYYTGQLINGTVFDGTTPGFPTDLPVNKVIPGWIEALLIMREGDHWQLVIPANLGYGSRTMGGGEIPPNQTLVFDMRLIATKPAPKKGDKDYIPDPNDKDDDQQP